MQGEIDISHTAYESRRLSLKIVFSQYLFHQGDKGVITNNIRKYSLQDNINQEALSN